MWKTKKSLVTSVYGKVSGWRLYLFKVVEQDFNAGFSELPSMMVVRIHKLFKRRPRSVPHLFLSPTVIQLARRAVFFVTSQSSAARVFSGLKGQVLTAAPTRSKHVPSASTWLLTLWIKCWKPCTSWITWITCRRAWTPCCGSSFVTCAGWKWRRSIRWHTCSWRLRI